MIDVFEQKNAWLPGGFWLLILLLLSSCAGGQQAQSIIMDMNYHDARKIILQSGWRPAEGMPPYEEIGAQAHYFRDLGYAEVYDCAGDGLSPCSFYFQNEKGEYLRIGTEGEEDNDTPPRARIIYAAIRDKID